MSKSFFKAAFVSLLSIGAFSGVAFSSHYQENTEVNALQNTYTNGDGATYYNGISSSLKGNDLLAALRTLNSNRRKNTVGYSAMGTTPSGQFKYTDYDPATVKYDSNGQPYGTKLISFYSGNSATSGMNREHVWPDSHGGNKVEADIHMPRPTITSENGSRGNSFYVEGMKSGSLGWDPAMEDFGVESYRGDAARIIFYCVVADSRLSLIDDTYHATSKQNNDNLMGKLSDMLKWNLNYPVLQREKNRNEGAEYLQGNRNPFIDHPEYACKIWGNTNDATKAICQGHMGDEDEPSIRCAGSFTKTTYNVGDSLDPSGVTIIYNSGKQGEADIDVTSQVTWEPTKFVGAGKIEVLAKYQNLVTSCGKVTVNGETIITNPVVGTKYKLGLEHVVNNSQLFIDGDMASNGYALQTTSDKSLAADVVLETASGGYYLKVLKQGSSAKYLDGFANGSYVNLRLLDQPSCVWKFNTIYNTFTTEISGCTNESKNGTNFIGTYGTYTDLRISSISYITNENNYAAHLYASDGGQIDPPDEESLTINGSLETEEYYVGETFDPTGLFVDYTKNGVATNVTSEVTWSLDEFTEEGTFELVAYYKNLSAKYDGWVFVYDNLPEEELVVSGSLNKTTYEVGDWLNPSGVTINYVCDGEIKNVTSRVTFSPMKFEYEGEFVVTASYSSQYSDLSIYIATVTVVVPGTSSDTSEYTSESTSEESYSSETSSSSEEISTSTSQQGTSSNSDSSGDKPSGKGGGCSASIRGNSSIVFILGFVALFFAIRHLVKIKKEDK